jgi:hypothetical protein
MKAFNENKLIKWRNEKWVKIFIIVVIVEKYLEIMVILDIVEVANLSYVETAMMKHRKSMGC